MINQNKVTNFIVIIAMSTVLAPFIFLGDNYAFTVHDYLDSYPGWMHIVQKIPAIPSYNETSGIMGGMPAFYFYREITVYMILNHYFSFVQAELINRFLTIVIGYFSMKYLLQLLFKNNLSTNMMKLIAISYAITPALPQWTLGMAILPLLIAKLYKYSNTIDEKLTWRMLPFIFVGFLSSFVCLGLFVCIVYMCAIVAIFYKKRALNKALILSLVLMSIGFLITNVHWFTMVLSGIETNRILMTYEPISWKTIFHILQSTIDVLLHGQYHVAPILTVIRRVCLFGFVYLYINHRAKKLSINEYKIIDKIRNIFIIMCVLSLIYALDEAGVERLLLSSFIPIFKGFNLGRIVYINNVLWYILFALMLSILVNKFKFKKILFTVVCLQILAVLFANGFYQDTRANIINCFMQKNRSDKISYQQFIAPKFWSNIKNGINYNNEGVVSVGMHPSIAQTNGFNTLDGYLSVHPMKYHNQFREIIEPTLEKYDNIEKYYDTWGGRMYVYADDTSNPSVTFNKNLESKYLFLNVNKLKELGGKYIFSRYKIINADELGIKMIYEQNSEDSIYHILVYELT